MALPTTFYTLSAVARMLGQDEDWLWLISCGMEGDEGCIGVIGPNEEYVVAFSKKGIEHLKELVAHYQAHPEDAPQFLHS